MAPTILRSDPRVFLRASVGSLMSCDALIRGRPLKPYIYEDLLVDVEHPHQITPGSIQSLIEEASSLRPETLSERPWSSSPTDGLGSAVVSLFDVAGGLWRGSQAQGHAEQALLFVHVDEEDLARRKARRAPENPLHVQGPPKAAPSERGLAHLSARPSAPSFEVALGSV